MDEKIYNEDDLFRAVEEYGILTFWDEAKLSAWTMSGVSFMKLWYIRERLINTKKVAYGKFANKKATFVSLSLFPALCALRRDGYDFDSLCDEGLCPHRESLVMDAVLASNGEPVPRYALGKSLSVKGYDGVVDSLQNKTYLCMTFKKSMMGTALISTPEDLFGHDFVRSQYSTPTDKLISTLSQAKGLCDFDDKTLSKILSKAI